MAERLMVGILPAQFQPGDASAVIGLAAAAVAAMAALGNLDPATADKVLLHAAEVLGRMRPEAHGNLMAAADELVAAVQAGKSFMVLGSFSAAPSGGNNG